MIDPFIQLAFNIHSNPGVFALLLGSGVSRSSGIPTGWEVVLDLIRRVAALEGEECDPNPESWYIDKYNEQADYSSLLERLAPTPDLRQQLLRSYFEPTDQEREESKKMPTIAHHSIAKLVRQGAFRVIITTNFDRLIEAALEADGITPSVISSPDDVDGAIPLVHGDCTVVKVHGDYLDTRIKNSPSELEQFDHRMDALIDRIFDEFGLIACGWSSDYDTALRSAIRRAPSRRYPFFWTTLGPVSPTASELMRFRQATEIGIDGADTFFARLEEKHDAIIRYAEPHPLSRNAALQTLKKYLSEPRFRISLDNLLRDEVRRTEESVNLPELVDASGTLSVERLSHNIRCYEEATSTLRALFACGTYWSSQKDRALWGDCFVAIGPLQNSGNGSTALLDLRMYPALLLKYVVGITSVLSNDYHILSEICTRQPSGRHAPAEDFGLFLHQMEVVNYENANALVNFWHSTDKKYHTPMSDHLFDVLRQDVEEQVMTADQYMRAFDKFEYLAGLIHLDLLLKKDPETRAWLPFGSYRWRSWGHYTSRYHVANAVAEEIAKAGDRWPPLQAGLFGGNLARLKEILERANKFLNNNHFQMWD